SCCGNFLCRRGGKSPPIRTASRAFRAAPAARRSRLRRCAAKNPTGGRLRRLPEFRARILIFARSCTVGQTFLSVRFFLPLQRRQAGMPVLLPWKQRFLRAHLYLLAKNSSATAVPAASFCARRRSFHRPFHHPLHQTHRT